MKFTFACCVGGEQHSRLKESKLEKRVKKSPFANMSRIRGHADILMALRGQHPPIPRESGCCHERLTVRVCVGERIITNYGRYYVYVSNHIASAQWNSELTSDTQCTRKGGHTVWLEEPLSIADIRNLRKQVQEFLRPVVPESSSPGPSQQSVYSDGSHLRRSPRSTSTCL